MSNNKVEHQQHPCAFPFTYINSENMDGSCVKSGLDSLGTSSSTGPVVNWCNCKHTTINIIVVVKLYTDDIL